MVNPKPVVVRSSRPGTSRELVRVIAAKPAAASTAMPALVRTARLAEPGRQAHEQAEACHGQARGDHREPGRQAARSPAPRQAR